MLEYQLMIGMRVTKCVAYAAKLLTYSDLPKRHEISLCISQLLAQAENERHCLNGFSRITFPASNSELIIYPRDLSTLTFYMHVEIDEIGQQYIDIFLSEVSYDVIASQSDGMWNADWQSKNPQWKHIS